MSESKQTPSISLKPIAKTDQPQQSADDMLRMFITMTIELYERTEFVEPWIGYVAYEGQEAVGVCGFKSPPKDQSVEIAYATLSGNEGRGVATEMARELITIARQAEPTIKLFAQTLPHENPSTTILRKLGFEHTKTLEHPEDGTVWQWEQTS